MLKTDLGLFSYMPDRSQSVNHFERDSIGAIYLSCILPSQIESSTHKHLQFSVLIIEPGITSEYHQVGLKGDTSHHTRIKIQAHLLFRSYFLMFNLIYQLSGSQTYLAYCPLFRKTSNTQRLPWKIFFLLENKLNILNCMESSSNPSSAPFFPPRVWYCSHSYNRSVLVVQYGLYNWVLKLHLCFK